MMNDEGEVVRPDGTDKGRPDRWVMGVAGTIVGVLGVIVVGWTVMNLQRALAERREEVRRQEELERELGDGRQVTLACRSFAADWDGEFPPNLHVLIPDYIDDESIFYDEETGELRWVYQPGLTDTSFSRTLLWSREKWKGSGNYVVAYVGGHVVHEPSQPALNAALTTSPEMEDVWEDYQQTDAWQEREWAREQTKKDAAKQQAEAMDETAEEGGGR